MWIKVVLDKTADARRQRTGRVQDYMNLASVQPVDEICVANLMLTTMIVTIGHGFFGE